MALRKIKLGELLEQSVNKNNELLYSLEDVRGISIKKIFIETKADMEGVSLKPYLIVKPDEFAYVTVTSRNGEKITLAYNNTQTTYIVSSSYVVFRVKRKDLLNSTYLFMYFNRPEFDRYSRYNSWGSAREVFTWQEMCDIEIELPDLETQEKFVNVYQAMCENQKAYERGLDDLKLVCDGYIENLRRDTLSVEIGKYIEEKKIINREFKIDRMYGLTNDLGFQKPNTMSEGSDIGRYKCVSYNDIVYPPPHFGEIGTIDIFKYEEGVVSPMYVVFSVKDEGKLNSDYLIIWLKRKEFMRYAFFSACDSIRDTFDFGKLCEYKIPIPNINVQKSIADIYKAYIERKKINERLKEQIKDLCPILIKGSIEESK